MSAQTDVWNGQDTAAPVMVTVSEDGAQVPLDVASKALIHIGKNDRVAYKEGMAAALLGDK